MVRMNPHLRAFVQWSSFGMLAVTSLVCFDEGVVHDHGYQFIVSGFCLIGLILVGDWILGSKREVAR